MIYFFTPTGTIFSIHASTLALLFVFLDFVSFVTQIAGGSMTGPASPPEQVRNGLNIYMGGIGMQQAFIVIFLVIAVKFHLTMVNQEKMGRAKAGWKKLLFALYGSLSFITVSFLMSIYAIRYVSADFSILRFESSSALFNSPAVKGSRTLS